MSPQTVKFRNIAAGRHPVSVGRNGDILTTGVTVSQVGNNIWLQPVNTKGQEGRCAVGMPGNPEDLRELAAVLLLAAEDLDTPNAA